jgi:ketosteroid isomerase-like protein
MIMASGSGSSLILGILEQLLDAFNRHDLDAIMGYFAEECTFDMPRGPEPWGRRWRGKAQVREGLASRFTGIPDVHYGEARHWVCGDAFGVSDWTLTGTTTSGIPVNVRGCDHYTFRDGKIVCKDSYWKIVE